MACFWNLLPTFPFPSFPFRQERKGPDIGDSSRFHVILAREKRELIHCRPGRAGHQLQTLSANGPFGICAAFAQLSFRGFAGGFRRSG
ncbi:hypothetical protein NEUTE1DRAFT_104142 [Neurospora tetrasperma FGSC 2508]|uniref:Uncharacterized protein n=1 Tax=Neurospora tetrasperma (strain FGSC 2508 / ATCC MYA-4615 / P0657) TaxID=510951 RepID=F8MVA9_NEUT8|nr:uncharacterized protein NEUTE1DRAFT_104142 [Neurospora tetrasperma FGSC 2508]EGO54712.1 hypothetical protein NEUTE1DRAFT_104142 [Neurospora tetrasperma FGSC 2508]EGZ67813.1 hypothetical protein NEUTE2DRAFT_132487 [Neurospora tetrasperma FGSC 2509]